MTMSESNLRTRDAVEIGHAWVQRLAESASIRVLFLKGPNLGRQGLRPHHESSDIDAMPAPEDFDSLCRALEECGWRERPLTLISRIATTHSRTYVHDYWPCDIDVHGSYPGLLAGAAPAFEELWRHRVRGRFANQPCWVTDRVASIVTLGLHSVRGTTAQPRHEAEMAWLMTVRLTSSERRELARLAVRTGAAVPLTRLLHALGADSATSGDAPTMLNEAAVKAWDIKMRARSHAAYVVMSAIGQLRGASRLTLLWHAIWPTRRDLMLSAPHLGATALGRATLRGKRLVRGLRHLVSATITSRNRGIFSPEDQQKGSAWN